MKMKKIKIEEEDAPELQSEGSINIKEDRKIGSEMSSYNIRSNNKSFQSLNTEQIDEITIHDIEDLEKVRFYLQANA